MSNVYKKSLRIIKSKKVEALVFLVLFVLFFGFLSSRMGLTNMLNTIMNTAHALLIDTVFYIMGITVLMGAFGRLLLEFGVINMLEKLLAPLMRPLYNLPGRAALAGLLTFLSDNPAIITLASDKQFASHFTQRQLVSLTNFGTAFGMGIIVITFMGSLTVPNLPGGAFTPALIGLLGAVVGSIVSTRLMQAFTKKDFAEIDAKGTIAEQEAARNKDNGITEVEVAGSEQKGIFLRFINALLDGGKSGVDLGLAIIPGVLIICTFVMMITRGPIDPAIGYQGLAFEGVPILAVVAGKLSWLFQALFGFNNPEFIAFPITSLGAVGAALTIAKEFATQGILNGNAIAVFTAMGMCWSGYLSTHTAMLDTLGYRNLTSKALLSHTIGGLAAGISAHYIYILFF